MKIKINEKESKYLNVLNVCVNDVVQETKKIEKIHHVHIIDRSGSMYSHINKLVDNIQLTFDVIRDDDLVSIIWFSSPGEGAIFLKGARKSDIKPTMLDKLRSVLGCTCFSDPIRHTKEIIDDLREMCPVFSVNLFTDGVPVVPWSDKEELNKCTTIIDSFKEDCIAFNTIGYGHGYNFEFLKELSDHSEYGTTIHSSKIENYLDIFRTNFDKVKDTVVLNYTMAANNEDDDLIYIADGFVKLFKGTTDFRSLSKNENIFGFVSDVDSKLPELEDNMQMLYALAYLYYYNGNRKASLDIIRYNIFDKALIDSALDSFTIEQTGEHLNKINKCIFDKDARFADGACDSSYRLTGSKYSVIDLLNDLIECDAEYVPYSKHVDGYKRTTRERKDSFNMFKMPENLSETSVNFNKLVLHKTRMNVSILFNINGTVALNPKQAKAVNLDPNFPAIIFRTHSIITDGRLNVTKIHIKIPSHYFVNLENNDVPVEIVKNEDGIVECIIDLTKMPIISNNFGDVVDASTMLKLVEDINYNEASVKVYKALIAEKGKKTTVFTEKYSDEQIALLESFGIKDGVYSGINNSEEKVEALDFYMVKTLKAYIKGIASVPSMNAVLTKSQKPKAKMNVIEQYMYGLYTANSKYATSVLEDLLKKAQIDLIKNRMNLSSIKLFTILSGDWIENLVLADNNKEYVYTEGDLTLVVSPEFTKEYL